MSVLVMTMVMIMTIVVALDDLLVDLLDLITVDKVGVHVGSHSCVSHR